MKPSFTCLFYLENETLSILKIKRTEMPAHADNSDSFKWLFIDKVSLDISQLWFSSMGTSNNIEERFFDQGHLKFNTKTGTFTEKFNSVQHDLVNLGKGALPPDIKKAVHEFLLSL